jgi:hypothetical protein
MAHTYTAHADADIDGHPHADIDADIDGHLHADIVVIAFARSATSWPGFPLSSYFVLVSG